MIHQYELKAEEICTYTRQVMKQHIQIEANGYSGKTEMIFDLLMKASAECSSLEAVCADLEEVADSNTVREYVNKHLPVDQLSKQEEDANRALGEWVVSLLRAVSLSKG